MRGTSAAPHAKMCAKVLEQLGGVGIGGSVLDFGCGLGRLVYAFSELPAVRKVTGVDQSVHHLQIARKQHRRAHPNAHAEFVLSSPDLLGALEGRMYDFVHSTMVLQHMVRAAAPRPADPP